MRRFLILSVVAVAVGGCGSDSKSGGSSSTKAVALPATLGDFRDIGDASAAQSRNQQALDSIRAREETTKKLTTERYRKAYGGAAADYRAYADSGIEMIVAVIAVRADSPGLTFGPVPAAKDLGLEKAQDEIVDTDGVECRVRWDPIPAGQAVTDDKEHVIACQKSQDGLTVLVQGGGLDGRDGLGTASKLTNDAFDAVK